MKENKYEWLYENCVNGNWMDARKYMKRKSKKFLVEFILSVSENCGPCEDAGCGYLEAINTAKKLVVK